ncbi:MAG: hypothetical protein B7Z76_15345 [Acidiphilium sp. 20-67-58]|uniref:hypothetical protein n=1 Tax=Acidiphilium sp. 20-67-58 TaxID=1970291 RepID=UPI000BD016A9|nr:hypothetical protein [Acidiphilium sp. 20-67-58]OYV54201.1 MAG: hypothetical protein B7Z76_15345 [Acidiphilium sp. 20-67-58]
MTEDQIEMVALVAVAAAAALGDNKISTARLWQPPPLWETTRSAPPASLPRAARCRNFPLSHDSELAVP